MEIIAKTDEGVLIKATNKEVEEILLSVTGKKTDGLSIGQKIPAIDYAGTIKKLKALPESYEYKRLMEEGAHLTEKLADLQKAVDSATQI